MKGSYYGKEGLVEVGLKTDSKTGLFVRPGTSDGTMVREAFLRDYSTVDCAGHLCLDLGGNVGGFILKAANEGARAVVSYEPEPNNFAVMVANAALVTGWHPSCMVDCREAAVSDVDGNFDLVLSPGSNSPCSASLTNKLTKSKLTVKVRVDGVAGVLDRYKATLVKMDIEGAEYGVLAQPMPDHVREMAIELHGFSKSNRAKMYDVLAMLDRTGWTTVDRREKKIFGTVQLITVHVRR